LIDCVSSCVNCEASVETTGNAIFLSFQSDVECSPQWLVVTTLLVVRRHISLTAKGTLAKMFPSNKHRECVILSPDISPFRIHFLSTYKCYRLMASEQ